MRKGDLLTASVLDNGLDQSVVDLGQGDLEAWGAGRKSQSAVDEGQNGGSKDGELHDETIDVSN